MTRRVSTVECCLCSLIFLVAGGSAGVSGFGLGNWGIQIASSLLQVPPDIVASQLPMAAPIPTSLAEMAQRKAVDKLLDDESDLWSTYHGYPIFDDNDGDVVNDIMAKSKEIGKHKPSTYGEVTTLGARQLFYHMGMSGKTANHNKKKEGANENDNDNDSDDNIVFMDMGSGVGKLVVQAYMELPRVSRAIGIELAPIRHQNALSAWDELEDSARSIRRESSWREEEEQDNIPADAADDATVEFLEGDIFEADISQATHLYISSLCFSDDMMRQLATKLEREGPHLQCVASLKNFPVDFEWNGVRDRINYEVVRKVFKFGMVFRSEFVEMSWTRDQGKGCEVTIYTKSQ